MHHGPSDVHNVMHYQVWPLPSCHDSSVTGQGSESAICGNVFNSTQRTCYVTQHHVWHTLPMHFNHTARSAIVCGLTMCQIGMSGQLPAACCLLPAATTALCACSSKRSTTHNCGHSWHAPCIVLLQHNPPNAPPPTQRAPISRLALFPCMQGGGQFIAG
jgi:hypothetical protein